MTNSRKKYFFLLILLTWSISPITCFWEKFKKSRKAYEQVDNQRRQRAQQQGVTQQLNITGKGAEIFAKRQERMNNYVADGDNKIRSVAQRKSHSQTWRRDCKNSISDLL